MSSKTGPCRNTYKYLKSIIFTPSFLQEVSSAMNAGFPIDYCAKNKDPLIFYAVRYRKFNIVKGLVDLGASLKTYNLPDCRNVLMYALTRKRKKRDIDIIRFLVENTPDLNQCDRFGCTVLDIAIRKAPDVIEMIEAREDELTRETKIKALWQAAYYKNIDLAKKYLDEKLVDINDQNSEGNTLLHNAVRANNLTMTKLILEYGANVNIKNNKGETPIVFSGTEAIFDALVAAGADIFVRDEAGNTVLHRAVGKERITKKLLDSGVDPNATNNEGQTAIFQAKGLNTVEILLNAGAELNIIDNSKPRQTPLLNAIKQGDLSVIKRMLEAGADPDYTTKHKEISPLVYVLKTQRARAYPKTLELLKILLKYGADVTAKDSRAIPLLELAIGTDQMKCLLEAGADPNQADPYGTTPLHRAINADSKEEIELLLSYGADPEKYNICGNNALMMSLYARDEIFELVLSKTRNVNCQNKDGETALSEICRMFIYKYPVYSVIGTTVMEEYLRRIKTLINAGADPWLCDKWNRPTTAGKGEKLSQQKKAEIKIGHEKLLAFVYQCEETRRQINSTDYIFYDYEL